jgi:hypothetical protein
MASCTSVFTGRPLTAGVEAPAIEYLATGDQNTAGIPRQCSQIFQANMRGAPATSIRSDAAAALRHTWNSNCLQMEQ